jgi:glycosidase
MLNTPPVSPYFLHSFPLQERFWRELGLQSLVVDPAIGLRPPIMFFRELAGRFSATPARAGRPVSAGLLNLYATQQKVLRLLIIRYISDQCPGLLTDALQIAGFPLGSPEFGRIAVAFCAQFPGAEQVVQGCTPEQWLADDTTDNQRRQSVAVELLLLHLARENRAVEPFRPLVDDRELARTTQYPLFVRQVEALLADAPLVAGFAVPLTELLRLPLKAAPDSLYDQLAWMREQWRDAIPAEVFSELEVAFTEVQEEWRIFAPRGEPGGAPVLEFGQPGGSGTNDYYPEFEAYSADTDWMPNVVLLAKMVYVWLGQLSRQYGEEIHRLDQIPDAELDCLAKRGFTGLWLIGLWERSEASRRIKHISGNHEAIASAYSLYDYTIAQDLGGEAALWNLRERALKRGIRLASDMVPNHTGLYSRWIVEHPDWFVQLDYPPYPAYTFTGPDLSASPEVSLHIEDGYWDRRDAAVVFKHYDHRDGRTRYIYHGNDGTSTPWNDTAQLNYLLPEVREAVIGTIQHVARMFPIIRFDAAMTLAKKHYQRLWFPQPGHGGVASRAEYGMARDAFDAAMPEEFWRQVVDRIAAEQPDTLLLAEAFWLMEGYFVRTLGMHRVYNSAFMNMLKQEENAKYRQTIKNVLEFDPQVLQRFVNFMNNPDEKTAVEQFGKERKYFGACLLLATMPGLPMFGHGQVEGFHEKYGMEYKKALWEEPVDEHLVREHERLIFPLLRRRWLFSGADRFVFYDFWAGGQVNEDVFAYSNCCGDQRGLIVYHNRFAATSGWVRTSTGFAVKSDAGTGIRQTTLGEALRFNGDGRHYYVFRDYANGLEYIRNGRELCEQGLFVELEAYESHVFLDFREIWDDAYGTWGTLCHHLNGRGVASIDEEVKQIRFADLIDQFRCLLDRHAALLTGDFADLDAKTLATARKEFLATLTTFYAALARQAELPADTPLPLAAVQRELACLEELTGTAEVLQGQTAARVAFVWLCLHRCGQLAGAELWAADSLDLVARFGLMRPLEEELHGEAVAGDDPLAALDVPSVAALTMALVRWQGFLALPTAERAAVLPALLADRAVQLFVGRHASGGQEWIIKERWDLLVQWLALVAQVRATGTGPGKGAPARRDIVAAAAEITKRAATAGYQVGALVASPLAATGVGKRVG